jgi:hypothetical protein
MLKKIIAYKEDILAIIFLCICSFIFLNNLFLQSQIFTSQDLGRGDITHQHYPYRNFYSQAIKELKIPLWTSSISTGFPIFAEGQLGVFFLPNIVTYFFFPAYLAFNLSFFIVFILASVGTYIYCRYLGISRFPSLLSSIVYAFSFVFIGHILHITVLQTISLFPWLMLAADKFFSKSSRLYLLLFALIFSQQYLAGFIQCVIYAIIAIYTMIFLRYFNKPHFAKNILLLTFACLLGIGIAAVQFLPSVELFSQSTRTSSGADTTRFFYSLKDLVYFVNPFFWGDPSNATYARDPAEGLLWENNIYSGLIPFAFLLIGFLYFKKNKTLRPYIYLFFLTLIFSLGWLSILQHIPPFSMFRLPQRSLFLTSFAFAIIAGFGFDQMLCFIKKKISKKSLVIFIGTIIVILTFLDVFLHGQGYNGGISKDDWLKTPETAKYLRSQNISGRILSLGGIDNWFRVYNTISHGWRSKNVKKLLATRAVLDPNANMLYGITSVNGYAAFETTNTALINQLIFYGDSQNDKSFEIGTSSAKLLGMENVQYIVSAKNIVSGANDLQLVWQKLDKDSQATYKIYKNKQFIENIYPIKRVVFEPSTEQMINDLLSPNFNPKDTALIYSLNHVQEFPDEVSIFDIKNSNENITFQTSCKGNSFIVISNTYYPGWKAFVDGQEIDILAVNINSQGINIPAGEHNVRIFYDPSGYKVGKIISILSLLLAITILLWPKIKNLKP